MVSFLGSGGGGVNWVAAEWSSERRLMAIDDLDEEPTREGIPLSQWRSLPNSPTAEPDKLKQQ
ncbi:hypothetical protein CH276_02130 [Rhodococcus sp. 06-470-2]|jgi:hypothetical protein|uniref:hypothetical protein n=1 Tax=unclassified Rhodococcus (in: high G+C Gram-positive bacteria) TaxID=192944 RepID=UPI000B9B5070|nr:MULTISPECIES: hypothetical protein [unclassified Rhodococcus (in: high G+C Gram-positive bacteria)]OZC70214.1 hypothetical protein CH276_02130 [Rhodococcus sp. 06-470-2]OZE59753.1 hypothetical protein CH265_20500 [Rhodococcus sp. 05-2221-1B]